MAAENLSISGIWVIASFSFVVAMSGALVPGPLLTYTIMKTLEVKRRNALVGALVIAGHALLETALVVLLLAGFSALLKSGITIRIIGTVGGAVLVYLGGRLIFDLLRGRVRDVFLNSENEARANPDHGELEELPAGPGTTDTRGANARTADTRTARRLPHPIVGGIVVSMSNPYWWVWWGSIGLAFMAQYEISFKNWPGLLAFMTGHEAGDLAVYWLVSFLVSLGRNKLKEKTYRIILFVCALIMVGFGLYLGIKPHF